MNPSSFRRPLAVVIALAIVASIGLQLLRAQPATAPSDAQPTNQPQFDEQALMREFQEAQGELQRAMDGPDVLTDPAKRAAAAPKAIPAFKRMIDVSRKLQSDPTKAQQARAMELRLLVGAAAFGDAEARQALKMIAEGSDADEAPLGKGALLMTEWIDAGKNPKAQTKLLDRAEALAKQFPQSMALTDLIYGLGQSDAATDEHKKRAETIASGMDNQMAQMLKQSLESKAKMEALQGQPMTITGTTPEGKPFSTDQWKGKVVLVDFWATWCGPCIAELPRVKKIYADYHDKGLEILGVSNDSDIEALKQFMQENPDMPWPQLFDAQAAAKKDWHPVTMSYGIEGIPTMFLIDKKGVCRSVTARENFEEMIPKLLEEKQ
jgi:thiol-disulfide isomerase/thioredoxin